MRLGCESLAANHLEPLNPGSSAISASEIRSFASLLRNKVAFFQSVLIHFIDYIKSPMHNLYYKSPAENNQAAKQLFAESC